MRIHYELLGSVPEVECYRNVVDELLARYEQGRTLHPDLRFMDRGTEAHLIEEVGKHFFGLEPTSVGSMDDLIAEMKRLYNGS